MQTMPSTIFFTILQMRKLGHRGAEDGPKVQSWKAAQPGTWTQGTSCKVCALRHVALCPLEKSQLLSGCRQRQGAGRRGGKLEGTQPMTTREG